MTEVGENPRPSKRRRVSPSQESTSSTNTSAEPHQLPLLTTLNAMDAPSFSTTFIPPALLTYHPPTRPDASITLSLYPADLLPPADFRKAFELLRLTSKTHYAFSSRGWAPQLKKSEMRNPEMRYLVVRYTSAASESPDLSPLPQQYDPRAKDLETFGYLSFLLTPDTTARGSVIPVLYIYEIHLGSSLRGLGVGAHLMRVAEHIAASTNMRKVMLTVFTANENAEAFYRSRGYSTDETSPMPNMKELRRGKVVVEADYRILSLRIGNGKIKRRIGVTKVKSPVKRIEPGTST